MLAPTRQFIRRSGPRLRAELEEIEAKAEHLRELTKDDSAAWVREYQQRPRPEPWCVCPTMVIRRVQRGGTCGHGGCPYGGDF